MSETQSAELLSLSNTQLFIRAFSSGVPMQQSRKAERHTRIRLPGKWAAAQQRKGR